MTQRDSARCSVRCREKEIVSPSEIHGFLRWQDRLRADQATVAFLAEKLATTAARKEQEPPHTT